MLIPPTFVVQRRHLKAALNALPAYARRNVSTVWIHNSTLGIEDRCFQRMKPVVRILVWGGPEARTVDAFAGAVLDAFITAYEPGLVDLIQRFTGDSNGMYRVGNFAFHTYSRLREVVLPRSITHVGKGTFCGCHALTLVTKHSAIDCTSLSSVTLPDSLTHLGERVFEGCTSLISMTLPNSLARVDNRTRR
jgi:hypothetical protein